MGFPFIVVPTYRELANLPKFTEEVWRAQPDARILLVDDASGDGTPAWVKEHPRHGRSLFILERAGKLGLGSAYVAGYRWLIERQASDPCAAVVQMDADLSHDPQAIGDFLRALEDGADLALATRYRDGVRVTNWPLRRLMLSLGAARYVRVLTGMPFSDPTGGFKAFRPEKLAELDLAHIRSDGYAFQIEVTHLAWCLGWKIVEVTITFVDRHAGTSKMSGGIVREAVWRVPWMAMRGLAHPRRNGKHP
jgi:dolichol-phosphate mannosyltransferase